MSQLSESKDAGGSIFNDIWPSHICQIQMTKKTGLTLLNSCEQAPAPPVAKQAINIMEFLRLNAHAADQADMIIPVVIR